MNSTEKNLSSPSAISAKRTFLVSSASMALAACGSGNDAFVPTIASSDSMEDKLPKSLTESTEVEKGILQDLASLISTMINDLRNCKDDVLRWNQIAIDASGLDHTPTRPGETRAFGQQMGPGRSSRAMATIMHIAMYDAIASITRAYKPYSSLPSVPVYADIGPAIAKASFDTLSALFPAQQSIFQAALTKDLARVNAVEAKALRLGLRGSSRAFGLQAGSRAATAILNDRANDGSNHSEPVYGVDFIPRPGVGIWSPDPITNGRRAIGAKWAQVRPFTLQSAEQYRLPPPPALGSAAYAKAYDEVQRLGGDGITTPTTRTDDQTKAGIFWAYDGTPSLCAPPRLYNQVATKIAAQQGSRTLEIAR